MSNEWIDTHLAEIKKYQQQLNEIPSESKVKRIEILSKQLVYIGRLAATFSEQYKRIYATRKRTYAETYLNTTKNKAIVSELAVAGLREEEATAYGNMTRWKLAFEAVREEINAIKYQIRIDIEDGSSRG